MLPSIVLPPQPIDALAQRRAGAWGAPQIARHEGVSPSHMECNAAARADETHTEGPRVNADTIAMQLVRRATTVLVNE